MLLNSHVIVRGSVVFIPIQFGLTHTWSFTLHLLLAARFHPFCFPALSIKSIILGFARPHFIQTPIPKPHAHSTHSHTALSIALTYAVSHPFYAFHDGCHAQQTFEKRRKNANFPCVGVKWDIFHAYKRKIHFNYIFFYFVSRDVYFLQSLVVAVMVLLFSHFFFFHTDFLLLLLSVCIIFHHTTFTHTYLQYMLFRICIAQ